MTHDAAVIAALAEHIRLHRETFFHDAEAVAEREGMDLADLLEAVGWFSTTALPRYRGTAVMEAASAQATRLRHGALVKPASESRPDPVGAAWIDGRPGAAHYTDPKDSSRLARPCARCRNIFQPTAKRRLLCSLCFTNDSHDRLGALAVMP